MFLLSRRSTQLHRRMLQCCVVQVFRILLPAILPNEILSPRASCVRLHSLRYQPSSFINFKHLSNFPRESVVCICAYVNSCPTSAAAVLPTTSQHTQYSVHCAPRHADAPTPGSLKSISACRSRCHSALVGARDYARLDVVACDVARMGVTYPMLRSAAVSLAAAIGARSPLHRTAGTRAQTMMHGLLVANA